MCSIHEVLQLPRPTVHCMPCRQAVDRRPIYRRGKLPRLYDARCCSVFTMQSPADSCSSRTGNICTCADSLTRVHCNAQSQTQANALRPVILLSCFAIIATGDTMPTQQATPPATGSLPVQWHCTGCGVRIMLP